MKIFVLLIALVTAFDTGVRARNYHPRPKSQTKTKPSIQDLASDEDADFWIQQGGEEIANSLEQLSRFNERVAKNVILFVGDGMSVPTVTSARWYKEQQLNNNFKNPESGSLTFEKFPFVGLSKTFDIDYQVADSASTATAMFSGIKTKHSTVGFDSSIDRYDPQSENEARKITTMMAWAQDAGMDTGIVTTARITHATPAAMYAHSFDRHFESDGDYPMQPDTPPENVTDIAFQLVNHAPGNRAKVLLGGGASAFYPEEKQEEMRGKSFSRGELWDSYRQDGLNLADQWESEHPNSAVVLDATALKNVVAEDTDYLLGLLSESHVAWDDDREEGVDPTLTEMTTKALEILMKGDNGFFLMVEGGKIDHAHHDNTAIRALSETVAMDSAIEATLEMLGDELDDTLIIVTADHAHAMSISGYADRGTDIRGLNTEKLDDDLPYTILSYAYGPGFYNHLSSVDDEVQRLDLSQSNFTDFKFLQASGGYSEAGRHGGDDVGIYALGPMAHLFHKVHDQTHIANVMAYSACVGKYVTDPRCSTTATTTTSRAANLRAFFVLPLSLLLLPIRTLNII